MTSRRIFLARGLAFAAFSTLPGCAAAAAKPAITVHRSPT